MNAIVEISLYPLKNKFIPSIDKFIDKLHKYDELQVSTNDLSTLIKGDYDKVMDVLKKEMKKSFSDNKSAVFVLKIHAKK